MNASRNYPRRLPMGAATALFFFAAAATGFYLITDKAWGVPLKAALVAHPVVSIAATFWMFAFTLRKAQAQRMRGAWWRLLIAPAVAAVLTLSWQIKYAAAAPFHLWLATFCVFGVAVYCLRWPADAADAPRGRYYFFTGGLVWALWLALTYNGAAALLLFREHNIVSAVTLHRHLAYAMSALFLAHLYAVRPMLGPEERAATPVGRPARLGILAAILLIAAGWAVSTMRAGPRWTVPLSSIPIERRAEADRAWPPTSPVPAADMEFLDVTESCGNTRGCHREIVGEHKKSAHNISVRPAYFQVNLEDMGREIGMRNQIICAGCHFPVGALDTRKRFQYFKNHDNFSCAHCHSITGAGISRDDRRLSWYRVAPPWGHIRMFPPGSGKVAERDRLLIRLNAAGHRRAFKKPLHSNDDYCNACHHQQMPPLVTPGLRNPRCILCHMQPQELFGGTTRKKSHLFAGANVGPALLTGDAETAGMIRRWAEGGIVPSLKGWETLWGVRMRSDEPIKSVPWIMITFYHDEPPTPGRDFKLYIISTNTGLAHNFPSGSLDLAKAWLEFNASTEEGRVFCSRGAAAPGGAVPRDTATLGGFMMGRDGKLVTRNRVWQVSEKTIERLIYNHLEISDSVVCRIPEDAGERIHVAARWNYRKLDQDFLDYAYGKGEVAIPPIAAGRAESDIQVRMIK